VKGGIIRQVYPKKLEYAYIVLSAILDIINNKDFYTNKYVFPEKLNIAKWNELEDLLRGERPEITNNMINYFIKKDCIRISFNGNKIINVAVLHDIIKSEKDHDDLIIKLNRRNIDRFYSSLFKGIKDCEKELGILEESAKSL